MVSEAGFVLLNQCHQLSHVLNMWVEPHDVFNGARGKIGAQLRPHGLPLFLKEVDASTPYCRPLHLCLCLSPTEVV